MWILEKQIYILMCKVPKRMFSYVFFSVYSCNIYSLVSLDFVFIHFLLHVLSSVNFFNLVFGCRYDMFKVRAKSMDYIHSSCFLILGHSHEVGYTF